MKKLIKRIQVIYLNQRYNMPDDKGKALLTDIGTEELGHVEMICAMFYQLTKDATPEELKANGFCGNAQRKANCRASEKMSTSMCSMVQWRSWRS